MIFYSKDNEELYLPTNTNFAVGNIRKAINNIEWEDENIVHLYCDKIHNRIVFTLLEIKPSDEKEWIKSMINLYEKYGVDCAVHPIENVYTVALKCDNKISTGYAKVNKEEARTKGTDKFLAIAIARALGKEIPEYIMEV